MTKAEQETARHFAERYRVAPAEVSSRVERAVIGGDWGANGYTTLAQADWHRPRSTRSCTPTCCVDCALSSPC